MATNESSTRTPWDECCRRPSYALEMAAGILADCTDKFGHLEAILLTLRDGLPEHSTQRKLAEAGIAIATDMENHADSWREQTEEAARAAKTFADQNLQVSP